MSLDRPPLKSKRKQAINSHIQHYHTTTLLILFLLLLLLLSLLLCCLSILKAVGIESHCRLFVHLFQQRYVALMNCSKELTGKKNLDHCFVRCAKRSAVEKISGINL